MSWRRMAGVGALGAAVVLAACGGGATREAPEATLPPALVSTTIAPAPTVAAAVTTATAAVTAEVSDSATEPAVATEPTATAEATASPEPTPVLYLGLEQGITDGGFFYLGRADAPVTVVDYHDFLCPNCQRYVTEVEPGVIELYVQTGQARIEFRDVLNHGERSVRASEGAACAGLQGYFWHMHDLLFGRQNVLYATPPGDMAALMISLAAEIEGLDAELFATCINERHTLAGLQAADAEQRTRGITSQPVFEIGGQRLWGVQSLETMGAVILAAGD